MEMITGVRKKEDFAGSENKGKDLQMVWMCK